MSKRHSSFFNPFSFAMPEEKKISGGLYSCTVLLNVLLQRQSTKSKLFNCSTTTTTLELKEMFLHFFTTLLCNVSHLLEEPKLVRQCFVTISSNEAKIHCNKYKPVRQECQGKDIFPRLITYWVLMCECRF